MNCLISKDDSFYLGYLLKDTWDISLHSTESHNCPNVVSLAQNPLLSAQNPLLS